MRGPSRQFSEIKEEQVDLVDKLTEKNDENDSFFVGNMEDISSEDFVRHNDSLQAATNQEEYAIIHRSIENRSIILKYYYKRIKKLILTKISRKHQETRSTG